MRHRVAVREPAMMSELNITPLIDVMLVLLVMMILTLPALNHEIPIDLPQPGPVAHEQQFTHRLTIDAEGGIALDGTAVTQAALSSRLTALRADPRSELTMQTDARARYDIFADTLATVKHAGITRLGFVGHQAM